MTETRKLKLKPVGDPAFPHLMQVIDAASDKPLSHVVRLDVSFRAGTPVAPGTMHRYKTRENGQLFLDANGEFPTEQEEVSIVGLV